MKAYGGTCPMCCGDIAAAGPHSRAAAVCMFCGFTLERDISSSPSPVAPMWLQAGARSENAFSMPLGFSQDLSTEGFRYAG